MIEHLNDLVNDVKYVYVSNGGGQAGGEILDHGDIIKIVKDRTEVAVFNKRERKYENFEFREIFPKDDLHGAGFKKYKK